MSFPKKAFGVKLEKADLMSAGVHNHQETLSRRGITDTDIGDYDSRLASVKRINEEQEKAKADLKSTTKDLEDEMILLEQKYSEFKKLVKLEFPMESWKEFGIEDKH
jgi:uncharacterized phage protein gp47/JayE